MEVVEIFKSIEGEGIRSGYPCTFVRFYGCPLRCSYCDTTYAYKDDDYEDLSIEAILDQIEFLGLSRVTLTGGEPLIQPEIKLLIKELLLRNFEVNIETNGNVDLCILDEFKYINNLIITMDWKSISSGMSDKMVIYNLDWLRSQDVLKFVVGNTEDLNQMKDVLAKNSLSCSVFVSPIFEHIEPKKIVEYILANNLEDIRIQLQLHKIIWPADMRGV